MDNFAPLISIIVPVYNVEKYLRRCIDSIIGQTFHNIEIILVDDGSSDRCGEICDYYASIDSRIRVLHKENAGVNEARLAGFKESKGEYSTFIDSDDYVSPFYVESLYKPIKEMGVAMSCVQWIYVKGNHFIKDKRNRKGFFSRQGIDDILRKDFLFCYRNNTTAYNLGLCCKMIKRDYLEGAMETAKGLWIGEDLITNLFVAYRIPSVFILDEYLYYYVQHDTQSTRNESLKAWSNQVEQWERILELDLKHYLNNQLPYRILKFLKVFVRNNIEKEVPIATFVRIMDKALEYNVVKGYFVNFRFHSLKGGDAFFTYLLRNGNYKILYYLFKLALPVRRIIKLLLRRV